MKLDLRYVQITLPRLSDAHPPMPKRIKTTEPPGSSKSVAIHLKSARNPALDIKLSKVPLSTATVQDLKEEVQTRVKPTTSSGEGQDAKVPLEKIKILWKRKPVQGTTVAEVLADEPGLLGGGGHAEFGVMILGAATALSPEEVQAATAAAEKTGTRTAQDGALGTSETEPEGRHMAVNDVLNEASFWDQLEQFLRTKVHDDKEAARLRSIFRGAYQSSR